VNRGSALLGSNGCERGGRLLYLRAFALGALDLLFFEFVHVENLFEFRMAIFADENIVRHTFNLLAVSVYTGICTDARGGHKTTVHHPKPSWKHLRIWRQGLNSQPTNTNCWWTGWTKPFRLATAPAPVLMFIT
jgi:hypothetical protein